MLNLSLTQNTHLRLLPYYLFYTVIILLTLNTPFFWDKDIIISRRAFWFTENNFSMHLPNSIDNGYMPVLSLSLALLWNFFGKSLIIGHLLMLPFALGLIYQFFRFLNYLSDNRRFLNFTMILLLIDTTLLSQIVVVSNDLVLMFFFMMSLNSILYKKRNILFLAILGLSLSHARGVMACLIVFGFEVILLLKSSKGLKQIIKDLFLLLPQYLPAAIIFIIYQLYHFKQTGWIITHENSPWTGCFERVDFKGFIFNIGILTWRFLDFGRLFIWMALIFGAFKMYRKNIKIDFNIQILIIMILISSVIFVPSMLIYKVLSAHRYLLPVFSLITILTGYLIFVKIDLKTHTRSVFIILLVGLITGNLWIYPDKIAKGWDSTIAHLPYHSLKKKMVSYIDNQQIDFSDVGSDVPNTSPLKIIYLNDDERYFPRKDLKRDKYVFYSNVLNMFSDEEIDELKSNWIIEKEFRCMHVKVQLYRNPEKTLVVE